MRLKSLLITAFVALSAVPLFVGLQYLNESYRAYNIEQFSEHLNALAEITEERVQTAVDRMEEQTDLIAGRSQLTRSLDLWHRTGESLAFDSLEQGISDAQASLSSIHSIRIYSKNGDLVAESKGFPPLKADTSPASFRDGLKLHRTEGVAFVTVGKPLILGNRTIGFIRISYFADFLDQLVKQRTGLGQTGEWALAVRNEDGGALVATSLKYDSASAFSRSLSADNTDAPMIQALLGNETVLKQATDYRGKTVIAATRYLPEQDWGIVAKVDLSEVNELARQNESVIYIAEVVIILSAIGVGIVLAFYIARPVEKLSDHTNKIANGELTEPHVENPGWLEAKQLTDHFSYMISSLRELNDNLQEKVDERTHDLQSVNRELELLATQDHLTGLFNRRHFDQRFEEEFRRSKRYQRDLAVAVLDIDFFKSINDTYGHAVGDEVLKKLSGFLKTSVRDSDIAARTGGEEFCIVLTETGGRAAQAFLERFRQGVSELEFVAEERKFTITCSIGIAVLDSATENREQLLFRADQSLYNAKNNGRNQVLLFRQKTG